MSKRQAKDGQLAEQLANLSLSRQPDTDNPTTIADGNSMEMAGTNNSSTKPTHHRYPLRSRTQPTATTPSKVTATATATVTTVPPVSSQLNAEAQNFVPFVPYPQAQYSPEASRSVKPVPTKKLSKKQKAAAKALAQSSAELISSTSGHAHGATKTRQSRTERDLKRPRLHVMERPEPTTIYTQLAAQEVQVMPRPRPLLVVIDLNGTLLKRTKYSGTNTFTARPYLHEFLSYVLANHKLMIWSSARPENVATMCSKLFTAEQRKQPVAIWARDTLRLSEKAYHEKVQVYKQLSWIWNNTNIQSSTADKDHMWDQTNTVLVDDSIDKAASEPFNLLEVAEFSALPEQMESDTYLKEAMHYLSTLSYQADVSAYMRRHPFKLDDPEAQLVA